MDRLLVGCWCTKQRRELNLLCMYLVAGTMNNSWESAEGLSNQWESYGRSMIEEGVIEGVGTIVGAFSVYGLMCLKKSVS